ncbi:hypothetical protein J32TS6_03290 [Virgibacillus pantothenticus]|nr:hypothetical protein J32TS6_03290 [Virgibacillus pantothenticus]
MNFVANSVKISHVTLELCDMKYKNWQNGEQMMIASFNLFQCRLMINGRR